jgi:hypothetical protein
MNMKNLSNAFRVFVVSLLLVVGLAACQSKSEGDTAPTVEPTVGAATPTDTPTEIPPTEEPVTVNECLLCHLDKQRLIDTADPEEEIISENEGAG